MTVTWRSAVSYALTVTLGSWMTGALVGLAWSAAAGSFEFWVSWWVTNPLAPVFLAVTALTLTLARRLTAPMPVWRIPLIDGGAYLLNLLLCAGLIAWWNGAEAPADDAFVVAAFAMITLQLPSAWLLSYLRAQHLHIVLDRNDGGTKETRAAGSDDQGSIGPTLRGWPGARARPYTDTVTITLAPDWWTDRHTGPAGTRPPSGGCVPAG
ncbi:hypothetical protein [Streptomyces jumonjinensis]|uniref:hypothetical protein n=1 Tax=Streptomyces jumonjinensis TaxID=1945 RepID=UPI003793F355